MCGNNKKSITEATGILEKTVLVNA